MTTVVTVDATNGCVSNRTIRFSLPREYKGVRRVYAVVGGEHQVSRVRGKHLKVSFHLERTEGVYALVIRQTNRPIVKRLYSVCGAGDLTDYNATQTRRLALFRPVVVFG